MIDWTVIAIYADSGTVLVSHEIAEDAHEAMRKVAKHSEEEHMDIVGAIPGHHTMICACEDSGKIADVIDLIEEEEDADTDTI